MLSCHRFDFVSESEFDAIFDTDCMSKNRTMIDYKKKVYFILGRCVFAFQGHDRDSGFAFVRY